IVLQNGELLRTSHFTNILQQQEAFDIFKAIGYVMSDPEWRPIVLVAARTVLSKPKGSPKPIPLNDGASGLDEAQWEDEGEVALLSRTILNLNGVIRRSGVNPRAVSALMKAAADGGYFDDKPLLAETTDPEKAIVRKIADKLSTFEGDRSWRVRG